MLQSYNQIQDHETHNESSVVGRIPEFDLIFEKQGKRPGNPSLQGGESMLKLWDE